MSHEAEFDEINHPRHYNSHPSGIECITVAEWHDFNIGNVLKYIWRAGLKNTSTSSRDLSTTPANIASAIVDLKKARWYIDREIDLLARDAKLDG